MGRWGCCCLSSEFTKVLWCHHPVGGQAIVLAWYLLSVSDSHGIEIDQLTINIGVLCLRRGPGMGVDVLYELRRLFADLTSLRAMLPLMFLKSSGASERRRTVSTSEDSHSVYVLLEFF